MFVKIIRTIREETETESEQHTRESLYECNSYHTHPSGKDKFILSTEGEQSVHIEIEKSPDTEIYIMNNEGKTIDYYRWASGDHDGPLPRVT